jgi:glutamate racemase
MPVLDSSQVVAIKLKEHLQELNLLNHEADAKREFFESDYTESFEASTRIFFKEVVHLEKHPLWN